MRVWRNWRPIFCNRSLKGTAASVNTIFQNAKHGYCMTLQVYFSRLPKRNIHTCTQRDIHLNVDSSMVDNNSQRNKAVQICINWWMNTKIVVCLYNGILLAIIGVRIETYTVACWTLNSCKVGVGNTENWAMTANRFGGSLGMSIFQN